MRILIAASVLVAMASTASAQGVFMVGNEGILTAVEYDGDFTFRAGAISRIGGHDYDWMAGVGKRWTGRGGLAVDAALDFEAMPEAGYRSHMYPDSPVDARARIGIGWVIREHATLAADYSRSFNNETREGRWMIGTRFGW